MKPIVLEHPLVKHKLSILRDKSTGTKEFREVAGEIATMLCYEATKNAPLTEKIVETPLCATTVSFLDEDHYAFVPILRAGISMIDGVINLIPNAKVGHIGLFRDETTLLPIKYYFKMPEGVERRECILLDPMLATGGTACSSINFLKEAGARDIRFLCIIAAPEGLAVVAREHPDVQVYCAGIDEKLNEHGYIVPGLGDAGDRIFGTK